MKTITVMVASALWSASAAVTAQTPGEAVVLIRVLVMLKDRVQDGPRPFANVGGFQIRRSNDELKTASCPDDSNEKGELVCTLKCLKSEGNLRVQVVAPLKKRAPIVAGMAPPSAATVTIEKCAVKYNLPAKPDAPVRLVYRTALAMAEELRAEAPEVFAAVASVDGQTLRFKPLRETTPALQQLAKVPRNRGALQQLAEVGEVYKEAVSAGVSTPLSASASEYASGANSILLHAAAMESLGQRADVLVRVSAKRTELYESLSNVSRELSARPVLSDSQIRLSRDVKDLQDGVSESAASKMRAKSMERGGAK